MMFVVSFKVLIFTNDFLVRFLTTFFERFRTNIFSLVLERNDKKFVSFKIPKLKIIFDKVKALI